MPTIDDKVVAMSFENSKFEHGVAQSLSTLDKLKAALHFPNAGKGLEGLNAASKKVDLSHISKGLDALQSKLGYVSVAALTIFAQIATGAARAGAHMVESLSLEPLKAGYSEYVTNLNSIQTILSNTSAAGTDIHDVTKALDELNAYSDKTIYNFGEMAKNIGTFTAAGVDLDTSVNAIKGIANLAAFSGSNAEKAATAMYQLSQAIAGGKVAMIDWISVRNAGMGGAVFQRALAQTAVAMGTLDEKSVKLSGSMKTVKIAGEGFAQSLSGGLEDGWLTSDVLTSTLAQFTGDLTDAELAAQGFTGAQVEAIQEVAKTAQLAATEVKDIGTVFKVAQETAGSGFSQSFKIIFGGFYEAKKTFTELSNTVNGFINVSADARNKVLGDWKALGGRTLLIKSISTMFTNLGIALKPISQAFRDIFPRKTGQDLFELTQRFSDFVQKLKPSQETIDNLRRTFRGVFAVLSIGIGIIKGIFTMFGALFGSVHEGSDGFLGFTGSIGDFLVKVDEALKKGNRLGRFFGALGSVLSAPLDLLRAVGTALGDLFAGFSPEGFFGEVDGMATSLSPLAKIISAIGNVWSSFLEVVSSSGEVFRPILEGIVKLFQALGPAIGNAASNMNFEAILAAIRTGLFASLVIMFKQFLGKGSLMQQFSKGFGGGILQNLSKGLQQFQQNLKAKTLKEIAIAVALLAVSVLALSLVDPKRLKSSLAAMAVAFGELAGAMAILSGITKTAGFIKMPVIAASLILLAAAINVLSLAVVILSRLSWEQLSKGLIGVAVLLGVISVAVIPLSANSAGMIRVGIGLMGIAAALLVMATAVAILGNLSLEELGKGLGGIAVGLTILGVAAKFMPGGLIFMGAGLIAVAVGLEILAGVVATFGHMKLDTIYKGMASIGAALLIIGAAMHIMPSGPSMILTAGGLLIVSIALQGIARAVKSMGGMSTEEIAHGLIALGGALAILAGALYLMSGTLAGAAALTIAAAGIALLAPALIVLGNMSWVQIIKGLVALAGALGLMAGAALLLVPAVPAMLALGVALVLIGAGIALTGAGLFLIGLGLSAIAVAGPTAVGILIAAMQELTRGIIENSKLLVLGLLEIVESFAAIAPKFVDAVVKILSSVIDAIIRLMPDLVVLIQTLLDALFQIITANQPRIIAAGFNLIMGLLQGLKSNIGPIVAVVSDIIVKFLGALSKNIGKIVAAGARLVMSILRGIANAQAGIITAAISIVTKFLNSIANNLSKVVKAGLSIVTKLLKGISSGLGAMIKAGTNLIVNFIQGVGNAGPRIVSAATNAIIKFVNALGKNGVKLVNAGLQAIIDFLNGVAKAIDSHASEMRQAGLNIGRAIVMGMIGGITAMLPSLLAKAGDMVGQVKRKLEFWKSPPSAYGEFLGQEVVLGLANGLSDTTQAVNAATAVSKSVIETFHKIFQTHSPSKVMEAIGRFVGQGFAKGLLGYRGDINEAFKMLNEQLNQAMADARSILKTERAKLKELLAADDRDNKAIRESQKIIKLNQMILKQSLAGHKALVSILKNQKSELTKLATEYEKLNEKLVAAKDILTQLKEEKASAIEGFAAQFGAGPEIEQFDAEGNAIANQLGSYVQTLTEQIAAETKYKATLEQLKALGLDNATYEKLLEEGTAGQVFADQLVAGGAGAIAQINALDAQLAGVSAGIAQTAGNKLYDAGIAAQEGLVKGLEADIGLIQAAMKVIADRMVKAIRRALRAHSPSEEFVDIGKLTMAGLAQGISKGSKKVTGAVNDAAANALAHMRKAVSGLSEVVTNEMNVDPTISPILDLTDVRRKAKEMAGLMGNGKLSATASLGQASSISAAQLARKAEELAASGGTTVNFEQNNHSPKSLSEIEIYRLTKNQLSQVRSALEKKPLPKNLILG